MRTNLTLAPRLRWKTRLEIVSATEAVAILQGDAESFLRGDESESGGLSEADIQELIERRLQAKKEKNWADADAIRDQLKDAGVLLEDTPAGTTWRRG